MHFIFAMNGRNYYNNNNDCMVSVSDSADVAGTNTTRASSVALTVTAGIENTSVGTTSTKITPELISGNTSCHLNYIIWCLICS